MAHKELERPLIEITAAEIRHARDPENYPSRIERWELLLKKHPKRKKRNGR
jgi:hypothetical protein